MHIITAIPSIEKPVNRTDFNDYLHRIDQLPCVLILVIWRHYLVYRSSIARSCLLKLCTLSQPWMNTSDMILKTTTPNGIPFHNDYPFELYCINGEMFKVGMWCDRDHEIYIHEEDAKKLYRKNLICIKPWKRRTRAHALFEIFEKKN